MAPCNIDDPPSLVWSNSDLVFGDQENPCLVEKFRSRRESRVSSGEPKWLAIVVLVGRGLYSEPNTIV